MMCVVLARLASLAWAVTLAHTCQHFDYMRTAVLFIRPSSRLSSQDFGDMDPFLHWHATKFQRMLRGICCLLQTVPMSGVDENKGRLETGH